VWLVVGCDQFVGLPPHIAKVFLNATLYPNFTGTSQWASEGAFTNQSQAINFPWQLIFVPNSRVQHMLPEQYAYNTTAGYFEQLLPPALSVAGELLYWVFAVDRPGEEAFLIGELTATTDFYRSDFGDRQLFFKHTRTSATQHIQARAQPASTLDSLITHHYCLLPLCLVQ